MEERRGEGRMEGWRFERLESKEHSLTDVSLPDKADGFPAVD